MKNFFMKTGIKVRSILKSRYMVVIAVICAVVLTLPTLNIGFVLDDYIHESKLTGDYPFNVEDGSLFGLFNFFDGNPDTMQDMKEMGILPWWYANTTKVAFWRPLVELTHWLDFKFWPDKPWAMHLQSIVWYALVVFLLARFYKRIMGVGAAAGFALLIFAFDNAHSVTVAWIANRNILIVTFFGLLTLICHDRWRKDGWRPGLFLGIVGIILTFLAGEAAMSICAFLFSYMLFIDKGTVKERILSLVPYAIIGFIWLFFYKLNHFGTYQPAIYVDPVAHPLEYIQVTLVRLPMLLVSLFMEPSVEIIGLLPDTAAFIFVLAEVGILIILALFFLPVLKRDRVSRFWALSLCLSILPLTSVAPNSRILLLPGVAGMGLISCFVRDYMRKKEWLFSNWFLSIGNRVLFGLFILFHILIAPVHAFFQPGFLDIMNRKMFVEPCLAIPPVADLENKAIVIINPPVVFALSYLYPIREHFGLERPASCRALASGNRELRVTRVDDRSLTIENRDAGKSIVELPMQVGIKVSALAEALEKKVTYKDMSIEVLEINKHKEPIKVLYTFNKDINDLPYLFLQWKNNTFVSYSFPDVGESMILK